MVLSNITVKHHLVKLKLAAFTLEISLCYQRPVNGHFHTIYSVVPLNWIFSASFKKFKYLQYLTPLVGGAVASWLVRSTPE